MGAFIGLVHVKYTSALSLKKVVVDVLAHHSLTLSNARGQCYNGTSNMQDELSGLKTLIRQESRSAHFIHYFAHQLQLILVAISKKCVQVEKLVLVISNILNMLRDSFKRVDEFQDFFYKKTSRGIGYGRDTCWGSYYKSFENFIYSFDSIFNVLDTLVINASTLKERASTSKFLRNCQTLETVFILHLMTDVLGITYHFNVSLH
ncbi:hypothetical protein H5410_047548 [Solanum commersonii]|uniref:DUF4371 domain-containing protein n=1 Tax=Solanum commersonii TaxID=4109 RepID=A0A9J5XHE8_SOLCO|nr:hypothetical protein H5410_047548 [Solanum commersonii]